ncbi:MAG TPA: alpha/beta hydrolase, partial [Acidimicrobiia bacterium]|nr:alpha/beta hydrolase [Acidimicrobiia bacterium]
MSVEPLVGYARLGESRIAYQVMGEGPVDILITAGYWGTFDVEWEEPMIRLFLEQLASFARVIQFDRLGTGASDSVTSELLPSWEGFAEEIRCVLDAVGSERVALFAISEVGAAAMLFAATHPERCRALILFDSAARLLVADDYPFGMSRDEAEAAFDSSAAEDWGTGAVSNIRTYMPSKAGDPRFRRWVGRMERSISTPDMALRYNAATLAADARAFLPLISAPTLVLQRLSAPTSPVEQGRFLAEHIPGARLVELPGG